MNEAQLPFSPAAERNARPIGDALAEWLPADARVLEIGSGSGQHAARFHRLLPRVKWQTSEIPAHLDGLAARLARDAPSLPAPLTLDVADAAAWPAGPWDAVYTANTLHIMPRDHTPALVANAARCLRSGGLLIIYGPFRDGETFDTDSNRRFDASLRERDPAMGLRDRLAVERIAADAGLSLQAQLSMPANNRLLVFSKQT